MSAPQKIEDVLNPQFGLDVILDNAELETWLQYLPPAMLDVNKRVVELKLKSEEAEDSLELTEAKEIELIDNSHNITTKKSLVLSKPAVIKAKKDARDAKYALRMAEVLSKFIEERSGGIRKIATLRANTQQLQENVDYTVRARNNMAYRQNESHFPQQSQFQQPQFQQPQVPFSENVQGQQFFTPQQQ